jgi:hypothetical protein
MKTSHLQTPIGHNINPMGRDIGLLFERKYPRISPTRPDELQASLATINRKTKEKKLGRIKRRWEDNIKMDIQWGLTTVSMSAAEGTSDQLRKHVCAPRSWSVLQHDGTTDRLISYRSCAQKVSLVAPTAGGILQLRLNLNGKCFFIHLHTV